MTTPIVRAHTIRPVPTGQQERHFVQACGTARFAYNWSLSPKGATLSPLRYFRSW